MPEPDSAAIVATVYGVISQPAGARDWDRVRALYHKQALLTRVGTLPIGGAANQCLSLEDYIARLEGELADYRITEIETAHRCWTFGRTAQAASAYTTILQRGGERMEYSGVNLIQLADFGDGWKILSILWDADASEVPATAPLFTEAS